MLISKLQEVQDEHAVEIRLLHQEVGEQKLLIVTLRSGDVTNDLLYMTQIVASKEFMTQRLNAIEDAVASVRSEIARGTEQQHNTIQSHADKIDEMDDKLFALDKELLKLKLALPASMKAQLPTLFTDQRSGSRSIASVNMVETTQGGDLGVALKLQELATDIEAM